MTALNTTTAASAASITGRDGYITLEALLHATAHVQSLPEDRQKYVDMLDMCKLVRKHALASSTMNMILRGVEHHTGHKVALALSGSEVA